MMSATAHVGSVTDLRRRKVMKIDIKPEDKAIPEALTIKVHPELITRLIGYAESLDSSVDYVVGQILDQVLPSDKPAKQRRTKAAKEAIRKVA
jgi:predicted transcriptional regulator